MSDQFPRDPNADELADAGAAEAEEALAAAEETAGGVMDAVAEAELDVDPAIQEALDDAVRKNLHAKAWWSTGHNEHRTFLFANCLLFAGVLASWSRGSDLHGLDTIRGSFIFGLALYGFWATIFNIWFRQFLVAPFFLAGVLGIWVGIEGIMGTFSTGQWDAAVAYSKTVQTSLLGRGLIPLSSIAPGYWLLTLGSALILIVFLRGILGGRAKAKATTRTSRDASAGGSRRRRR